MGDIQHNWVHGAKLGFRPHSFRTLQSLITRWVLPLPAGFIPSATDIDSAPAMTPAPGLRADRILPLIQVHLHCGPRAWGTPGAVQCGTARGACLSVVLAMLGPCPLPRPGQDPRQLALEHGRKRDRETDRNSAGCRAKGLRASVSLCSLHRSSERELRSLYLCLECQLSGQMVEFISELQNAEQRSSKETQELLSQQQRVTQAPSRDDVCGNTM